MFCHKRSIHPLCCLAIGSFALLGMLGVAAVIKKNAPAMKQKAEKLGEDCINACKTVCEDICADPGQNAQSNQNGQSGQNSQSNQSAGQGQ